MVTRLSSSHDQPGRQQSQGHHRRLGIARLNNQKHQGMTNAQAPILRSESGNRMYSITAIRITSGEELKHRNGLAGFRGRTMAKTYRPLPPGGQSGRAAKLVCLAVDEVAFLRKVVVQRGVHGRNLFQRLHPAEALHCAFPSTEQEVGVFDPVVQPAAHLATVEIAERGG